MKNYYCGVKFLFEYNSKNCSTNVNIRVRTTYKYSLVIYTLYLFIKALNAQSVYKLNVSL